MKKSLKWLSAVALAAGLASAPAYAQKSSDTLRAALAHPLQTIDPYYSTYMEIFLVIGEMAFDSLVYSDPETGEPIPLLSTDFEWLDDKTLVYNLRQDVKWHDGQPFTSADVVYTFDYILNPENRTVRREYYDFIERVEADGDYKVTFHLNRPFGPTMQMMNVLPILPVDFFGPGGVAGGNGRLVGTGPYKIDNYTPGGGAVLVKNESYFTDGPKGAPSIGRFEYMHILEASTQISELMTGGVDWVFRITADDLANVARNPAVETEVRDSMRLNFLSFDVQGVSETDVFTDTRVRRAVAHAVNRDVIVKQLVGAAGLQHQPCTVAQFGCPAAEDVTQYAYDPEKSRALLVEAGFQQGTEVTLWAIDNKPSVWVAAIQADLAAVGIKANIRTVNASVLYENVASGSVPVFYATFGSVIRDVSMIMSAYFSSNSKRDLANDEELTGWVDKAGSLTDLDARRELYLKAAQRITEQVYWLPLWIEPVNYAYSKELDYRAWDDENPRFYLASWK